MNFLQVCVVLATILSTYILIFNYSILDIDFISKQRVALTFRMTRIHQGTQSTNDSESPVATNNTRKEIPSKELNNLITSPTPSVNPVDSNGAVLPTYTTYKAMIEDDTHASNTRSFPGYSACPYRGLRKPSVTNVVKKSQTLKCHRRQLTVRDCAESIRYFDQPGTMKAGQCDDETAIKICTISGGKYHERKEIQFSCDASPCKGKRISLGLFDQKIGKIKWRLIGNINRVSRLLQNHSMSSVFAPGFALLKCQGGKSIQVLSFPKGLERTKGAQKKPKEKRFNINIVLEDSLSRAHFYRTLSKTVSTFREIIYNRSIPSTLLEFEKVQSYASNTYKSLQRMFTAQKYLDFEENCRQGGSLPKDTKSSCTYGVEEMFTRYKRTGYSTLLQEERCWFDSWGSFLDPRKALDPVEDEKTQLKRWKEYVEILETSGRWAAVEDYGMSMLTCDAYKKYNGTNPFSSVTMPKICFAGRHYSSFFLEYLKRYTDMNDMVAQPFLAYTHLLTSHDTNARRIVDDDEGLADFVRHAAHLRNTVTIFLSDHGGKGAGFAAYTTQGREEVFQPFLFMIVPHEVSKLLGSEAMNALVVNQNRLVGVEDLYHSLVSILDTFSSRSETDHGVGNLDQQTKPELARLRGLFKPVPLGRTCEDMKLDSEVMCLCDGMDRSVLNDSETVQWAAEFALGTLNNRIQEQYTTALGNLASGFYGYGACQRYIGTGILRARHINSGLEEKLFFSLLAKSYDRETVEIFDVEVSFGLKQNANGITLNNLIRVSPFNKYEECADKGVDPKLCACHTDERNNTQWRNELYSKTGTQKNFDLKPKTKILDNPCLAIVCRSKKQYIEGRWRNAIETYEAMNACPHVTYNLIISFEKVWKTRISLKHPKSVTLLPRTISFLMTAKITWKWGKFIPRFTFEKRRWENNEKQNGYGK